MIGVMQTRWAKQKALDFALRTANAGLQGTLSIGDLDGNLVSSVKLISIDYLFQTDTILHIQSVDVHYNLWRLLLGEVSVDKIHIEQPHLLAKQYSDSVWFFNRFALPGQQESKPESELSLRVVLHQLLISNGQICFVPLNKQLVDTLSGFYVDAALALEKRGWMVDLRQLQVKSKLYQTSIGHFSGVFSQSVDGVVIDPVLLQINNSSVSGRISYAGLSRFDTDLLFSVDSADLGFFIHDPKLLFDPQLRLIADAKNGLTNLLLVVDDKQGARVELSARIDGLHDSVDWAKELLGWQANIRALQLEPAKWMDGGPADVLINCDADLSGVGFQLSDHPILFQVNLSKSRYGHFYAQRLNFSGEASRRNGFVNLDAGGNWGDLVGRSTIRLVNDWWQLNADFKLGDINPLLLAHANPDVFVLLNGNVAINGRARNASLYHAHLNAVLHQIVVDSVLVDSLIFSANVNSSNIFIDTLNLVMGSNRLNASGSYNTNGLMSGHVNGFVREIQPFHAFMPKPVEAEPFAFKATVDGLIDSLNIYANLTTKKVMVDSFVVDRGYLSLSGLYRPTGIRAMINTHLWGLQAGNIFIDSIRLENKLLYNQLHSSIHVWQPWLGFVRADIQNSLDMPVHASLKHLSVMGDVTGLFTPDTTASVVWNGDSLLFHQWHLADRLNADFSFRLNGVLSQSGNQQLKLQIDSLALNHPLLTQWMPWELSGFMSSNVALSGTASDPQADVQINISSPAWGQLNARELFAYSQLKQGVFKTNVALMSAFNDTLQLSVNAPLALSWGNDGVVGHFPKVIDASLVGRRIGVGNYYAMAKGSGSKAFDGWLDVDVQSQGALLDPEIKGRLLFSHGLLRWPDYGIDYRDIILSLTLDGLKIELDTLLLKRQRGHLLARGHAAFDSSLIHGSLNTLDLAVKADHFQAAYHHHFDLLINADAFFRMINLKPQMGGKIEILKSSVYLPGILDMQRADEPDKPLLLAALDEPVNASLIVADTTLFALPQNTGFFNDLTGRISIHIPRNTWVRSDDMSLELYGDVDVVKDGVDFELFGNIGIQRGQYTLYGKRLRLTSGEIVFKGGSDFNPDLDISVQYIFRDQEKVKRLLDIHIGGTLNQPLIGFLLDNAQVSEANAVSYLIFGKALDQLDQSSEQGGVEKLTSGLLTRTIASQLAKTISDQLNIDLLEVNAGQSWKSTSLTVGKYLTNNLFVVYERGFGESVNGLSTAETVTLEYELNRNLFLKLLGGNTKHSGIDIIFKHQKATLFERKKHHGNQRDQSRSNRR
jgi:translocation and assembly module TamB